MADDNQQIIVDDETRKKFPKLVEQILASQSMDTEEREYWLGMLPVMTDDQVTELRDILDSETSEGGKPEVKLSAEDIAKMDTEKAAQRAQRAQLEGASQSADADAAEDLLAQLENI